MSRKPTYEELERRVRELESAEQTLRENERNFRLITETIQDVFWMSTPGVTKMIFVSPSYEKIWGKSTRQLLESPRSFMEAIHPEDSEMYKTIIDTFHAKGKAYECEYRILTRPEKTLWIRECGYPITDDFGDTVLMTGLCTDITVRKQVETESKQALEELKQREKFMHYIIKYDPNAIAVYDNELNYIAFSDRYLEDYDLQERDILGKHHYEVFPEMPQRWKEVHQRVLQGATERNDDDYFRRPDGSITYNRWECRPWYKMDGLIGGMITYTEVTTERRFTEKALIESEERYRSLVMQSADCLILHDLNGQILDINFCACETYGYTREELLKMKVSDLDPDYDARAEAGAFYERMSPGEATVFEARQQSKDGRIFPVEVRLSMINYRDKILIQGLCRDISERKRYEAKLLEREAFLNTLIEAIPIPVFYKDSQGLYIGFNKAFESFFGAAKESIIGKSVFDINPPGLATVYHEKDNELLESGGVQVYESQVHDANGNLHDVVFNKAVFTDSDNNIKGLIGAILDITESKRAEKERLEIESRLQQAQKMESIGTLAGGIAHDFNNILFPIVALSEMLLEDLPAGSPEYENAEEILNAGKRASDLIKQILTFSRQSELKEMPITIQSIIKEVIKLGRSIIPSNIEIVQDIQVDCGKILADPTQVHQISMNLMTNAYHAVEETGGKISVQLKEVELGFNDFTESSLAPGRYAMLSISDTGSGLDPAHKDKIFEPYFTTKKDGKGTGMGLATVYGIVKRYEGHINVHSDLGKGTIFNIYLPLLEKAPEDVSNEKREKDLIGNESILLVDDEEPIVRLESQMLERLGYKVTSRTSSVDALEAFRANPNAFDLVITDMTMPNMTGDRLAKSMIGIKPSIPVVICTGFSERLNKERAMAIGIKGFLMKPVIKSEMAKKVREVLDRAKDNGKH